MDIFKMATQIANNMSDEDKSAIENMDMEKMLNHGSLLVIIINICVLVIQKHGIKLMKQ